MAEETLALFGGDVSQASHHQPTDRAGQHPSRCGDRSGEDAFPFRDRDAASYAVDAERVAIESLLVPPDIRQDILLIAKSGLPADAPIRARRRSPHHRRW